MVFFRPDYCPICRNSDEEVLVCTKGFIKHKINRGREIDSCKDFVDRPHASVSSSSISPSLSTKEKAKLRAVAKAKKRTAKEAKIKERKEYLRSLKGK